MAQKTFKYPFRMLGRALACLLVLLILLEGWRYAIKPNVNPQTEGTVKKLATVAHQFTEGQKQFLQHSKALAKKLQMQLEQRQPRHKLYNSMQGYPSFWGAGLYQQNQPVVWYKYSVQAFKNVSFPEKSKSPVKVQKIGNVLLWIYHTNIRVAATDGSLLYNLVTAKRIRQTNALAIANNRQFSLLKTSFHSLPSSVDINIYGKIPATAHRYRVLRELSGDSVGVVYATASKLHKAEQNWKRSNRFWWALFVLLCFVVIGCMLYLLAIDLSIWNGAFLQLLIIAIGWLVFRQIQIAEIWIPSLLHGVHTSRLQTYQRMSSFAVNSFFLLLVALTLKGKLSVLQFRLRVSSFFNAIFFAVCIGLINVAVISYTFNACYHLVYQANIALLTLHVFPGWDVFALYLCLATGLLALTVTLFAINHFLLFTCKDQIKVVTALTILSFICGLFAAQLFLPTLLRFNWLLLLSSLYFALIISISIAYHLVSFGLPFKSPLRNAAVYSLLIALAGTTVIYEAQSRRIDLTLKQTTRNYIFNKQKGAKKLTRDILKSLHGQFKTLTVDDLKQNKAHIQAQFNRLVETLITDKQTFYSFDLQMINAKKELIASYSTNLNSPKWAQTYHLRMLSTVMDIEQITKQTVRPIVQRPNLVHAELYESLYRGWIPIFGSHKYQPVAWIICSVYRLRPNLDKPLRAVMASLHYYDEQDSYLIQQFNNNRLQKTSYRGVKAHYPVYDILQPGEKQALENDSLVYYTNNNNARSYRNILMKTSPTKVIKTTTKLPGYQAILFSFFRLNFVLLVIGFVILFVYQSMRNGSLALFPKDEKFQYRIFDSFLLGTLVFLALLIVVSHITIKRQNKDLVKQQLFYKLQPIAKAIHTSNDALHAASGKLNASLDSLSSTLNIDASFYNGLTLSASTASQIYQQHLLPGSLPYPVYNQLYINRKRNAFNNVKLNGQQLLIGYRSVLAEDSMPVAVVAIPTFIQSPQFNEQLLQTTSYLIILYLIIFSVFIIVTVFISRQLSRPLYHIQQGLNKISQGNLETIPVTTGDEIGNLATAYNTMVMRLKSLQEELATTERDAAWQEMAQQVAHEIKNPLTPMKLNIQHLRRQLASEKFTPDEMKIKIENLTKNLIKQIQSLNNIASDFSKFSQPVKKEEFAEFDMKRLIEAAVQLYEQDNHVGYEVNQTAMKTIVLGVEEDLNRVIVNLIKNAREAVKTEGTIKIGTFVREHHLFLKIEDNGEGISEDDKPKVFVPNFSTKSGGTGLGLAISKKIIEAHNGSISFASIEGKGTTFIIKLPLV